MIGKILGTIIAILGIFVIVGLCAALAAVITQAIINYVLTASALVAVFGGPLTFWKAVCINLLLGGLFYGSQHVGSSKS